MSVKIRKIAKKILVWLAALLAALVFLAVFACGIVATLLYESTNNNDLQSWINQTFNASVKFQSATVSWERFYPTVILDNIQIASSKQAQKTPAIVLSEVKINVDVLKSIWHLRPVAHAIILQGLQLNIVQGQDKKYYLVGFISRQGGDFSWQKIWPWLQEQERIELLQAKVNITQLNQSVISFNNVNINWYHSGAQQYELASDIDLANDASNHLQFKAVFNGDLSQANGFSADFYTEVDSKDFAGLLKNYSVYKLNLLSADGRMQFWGSWQDNTLQRLHGIFNLNDIELGDTEQGVKLDYFNENVLWQRQGTGWQLLMQRAAGDGDETDTGDDNHIYVQFNPQGQSETWTVECSSVNLEMLSSLLQFWKEAPPRLTTALAALNPRGELINTEAEWTTVNTKLQTYSFNGSLQDFSINTWNEIPGVSGVSANFHVNPTGGSLQLGGEQVTLAPNYWFTQGWPPVNLSLNINWQQNNSGWQVNIPQLALHNEWVDFNGQGHVLLPAKNYKDADIQFLAGFNLSNLQQVMANYVPDHGISENLSQWLQNAFTKVPSIQGAWLWKGKFDEMPYINHQGRFEIEANAQGVSMIPWPQWPAINGINADLKVDGSDFSIISSNTADSLGVQLSNISLNLNNMGKSNTNKNLAIEADINTDGPSLKNYFQSSPLSDAVGLELENISISGPLSGHLKMIFPLAEGQQHVPHILGQVHFANNQIVLGRAPWVISNIQGSFSFSPTALQSEGLTATFLGDPLQVKMSSETKAGLTTQSINMQGILNLEAINQIAPDIKFKWWKLVSGNAPFSFSMNLSSKKVDMVFRSSLKGIALNLPAPFQKANNSDLPLKIEAEGAAGSLNANVTFNLGKRLAGNLLWISNRKTLSFNSGVITLGSNIASAPKAPGLLINGKIAYLSLQSWVKAIKSAVPNTSTPSVATPSAANYPWFNAVSLNIGNLNAYGQNFNNINVSLTYPKQIWQLGLNNPQIQGFIDLPQDWQQPVYVAHFNRVILASSNSSKTPQNSQQPQQASAKLSAKYLGELPGLSVVIDQLTLGQQSIGSVSLDMDPIMNGVHIEKLDIENQNISALVKGSITSLGSQDEINMQGNLNGKDWGGALASFGYPGFIQDGSGPISFQLHWLGSVMQPNLPTITGQVSFDLKEGGLSKLNPGLIRLLGLFSLDTLIQHLSFNFSDMTDKGLAFDTITGHYIIQNSIASTQDFRLTGPSLDLILIGQVNLAEQTLDQHVTVIPHVGGGIALAAGLIGGPVVGAATWVADKVIGNTILKDRGIVYHVTGNWNKPVVTSSS
ncbi:MAG: Membrane protein [Gammaproteobacteria bacterium]|jgi:uncharacterized protein (TIGR02099 family)|nr:Membrane protein [Gammaproteobacteria bacterium]